MKKRPLKQSVRHELNEETSAFQMAQTKCLKGTEEKSLTINKNEFLAIVSKKPLNLNDFSGSHLNY